MVFFKIEISRVTFYVTAVTKKKHRKKGDGIRIPIFSRVVYKGGIKNGGYKRSVLKLSITILSFEFFFET